MTPFFSIIIPSLNEEDNLPVLLKSLANQTDLDFEVIICDCLSKDKTREKAVSFKEKLPNLRFIQNKFENVSAARNFGAAQAAGQWLIFFDADVDPEMNFIKIIKDKIAVNKLDVITVWNRPKNAKLSGKIALSLANIAMSLFQNIKPGANGPCIIIKRNLFLMLKGFDEKIVFGEDFDLIQRAWRSKARFKVFIRPVLYVSTRRFDKEGLIKTIYKSVKALVYQLFFGPIRKPIFRYEMGGQYYKKNKLSINKKIMKNNTQAAIKYQTSAGGIVYKKLPSKSKSKNYLWLICQHSQHKGWVFPKGLVGDKDQAESMETAALREVKEEGGVQAKIITKKPIVTHYQYQWQGVLIKKTVYYYLMEYLSGDPKDHDWEISQAKFLPAKQIKKILTYKSDQQAFQKALDII